LSLRPRSGEQVPSLTAQIATLMLQDILGEPEWADLLTPADRRGLTPLFWSHVRPYGEVNLDMAAGLSLATTTVSGPRAAEETDGREPVEDRKGMLPLP
jgi:hypothetical protein